MPANPANHILCDLYLRLSDGRNENGSFADREATLRRKADQLGWTVHRVVVENDLSTGTTKNASAFKRRVVTLPGGGRAMRVVRPGFRSILDDLAFGTVQAVLAEDLDRTMRDPRDAEDLIDIVRERRAWADSLSGSLKFTAGGTDAEVMQARILVSVANKSSADTARRVAAARERTASHGRNGGGRRPYGFQPDGRTPDEAESAEIRRMADQVLTRVPLAVISRDLNDRGVPTVAGTRWTPTTVKDVLSKPRCAGIIVHLGVEVSRLPGEPILAEDTWRAVVDRLNSPVVEWTDAKGRQRTMPRQHNTVRAPRWLGTSIYLCFCGAPMTVLGGTKRAPAYICSLRDRSSGVHVRRAAVALDRYVTAVVVQRLSMADAAELVVQAAPGVDVNALRAEIATLRQRKADLAAAFAEGDIDRAGLRAGTQRIEGKLAGIEAQLATQTQRSALTPLIKADDVSAAWEKLSLGERRAVVKDLMTVTVLPTSRRGSGFDPDSVKIEPR